MASSGTCRMPDILRTHEHKERRVGVEIEISGLSYEHLVGLAARLLSGQAKESSRYVSSIHTDLGDFTIELDSDPIKDLDLTDSNLPESIRELGGHAMDIIDAAAEKIVPLEIVSPPLPFTELEAIESLCDELREAGALGSREALVYAFGLQLNPELPNLKPATLVAYFRAFAALYDWLKSRHQLDISRKFTNYIEPWSSRYLDTLLADGYEPDEQTLMEDYLHTNPTRNRALDLLPLFSHMNDELLRKYVQDSRIKSRPTLHYRLPDCDIDNPKWHFSTVWNDWVVLEQVVTHAADLDELTRLFRDSRKLSFDNLTSSWTERCHRWLEAKGYV
ncbi:amidoligase family protein [Marinobacter caseinilyticus]|uniref:amidoligase family protein n=1 Tax=Marinobacter caseinilyticus TaxID=2692195 RepID=UPI001F390A03|nr:amidoligase family protein [Marinobacter caseinilyticus]